MAIRHFLRCLFLGPFLAVVSVVGEEDKSSTQWPQFRGLGDGKIYVASDGGTVIAFEPADRYRRLARIDFDEGILATPALVEGTIYLRTRGHLYAFSLPASEAGDK